jgi:hypothetical protein
MMCHLGGCLLRSSKIAFWDVLTRPHFAARPASSQRINASIELLAAKERGFEKLFDRCPVHMAQIVHRGDEKREAASLRKYWRAARPRASQ